MVRAWSTAVVGALWAGACAPPSPPASPPRPVAPLEKPVSETLPQPVQLESGTERLLLVEGNSEVVLEPGTHIYDRICVRQQGAIRVRGSTTLVLSGNATSVIGGRGIGPVDKTPLTLRIESQDQPKAYFLFDNIDAPITADLDAKRATIGVAITGKTGLFLAGPGAHSMISYGGWGLPGSFPVCTREVGEVVAQFPPSVQNTGVKNCVGMGYRPSNYRRVAPADQPAELHVVGIYEGNTHNNGTVRVRVRAATKPVVLALSAYQSVTWQLSAEPGVRIKAVYVSGYEPQQVTGLSANVRVEQVKFDQYAYGWEAEHNTGGGSFVRMIESVRSLTGLVESTFQGCYASEAFDIPFTATAPPPTPTPAPEPKLDRTTPRDVPTKGGCASKPTFDKRGWKLRLAGPFAPSTKASELPYRAEGGWRVAQLGAVPNKEDQRFDAMTASSVDVDDDGTIVFRASWRGNPDQANNIGGGIYMLGPSGPRALVDAFTTIPGQGTRFNAFGIPDIEQGTVAFWGGRDGGQWTGVYLWRKGQLTTVAAQDGEVAPDSAPDMRGGRVGFIGRDQRGPGAFLWDTTTEKLTHLISRGDKMPGGQTPEYFFDIAMGDNIAAFAVGYDSQQDARGLAMQHRILGWNGGGLWTVADESWFSSPEAPGLVLQPNLAVDGDAVAFEVGAGYYSEIWVAEGCTLTRIAKSGDSVGQKTVRNYATIERESFVGGAIPLVTNFTDGSQGYVSAVRPR